MNKSIVRRLVLFVCARTVEQRTSLVGDKTVHVHHTGRAEYTLMTPSPTKGSPPIIKRVIMGSDVSAGEQRQLFVGTGVATTGRGLERTVP
jgi:Cupin superfamily (DUF985)